MTRTPEQVNRDHELRCLEHRERIARIERQAAALRARAAGVSQPEVDLYLDDSQG